MIIPIPRPRITMYSDEVTRDVPSPIVDIRYIPTAIVAVPTTGTRLYRPVFEINRPDTIEDVIRPAISGRISRPEFSALAPPTVWRYSGRKTIAPNIANPTRNSTPLATENTVFATAGA